MAQETLTNLAVSTDDEMKTKTLELVNNGFKVISQSDALVTFEKRPPPVTPQEVIIFFVLFLCCIIPGVIYFWVTFVGKFKVHKIVLRLDPEAAAAQAEAAALAAAAGTTTVDGVTWSADRRWWWDGDQWRSAEELPPTSEEGLTAS